MLIDGEIEYYERQLIEAWEPRFAAMQDELAAGCCEPTKVAAGQTLYKWVETEADFPLPSVRRRFLTHGSFHILANQYTVGWHPEYAKHTGAEHAASDGARLLGRWLAAAGTPATVMSAWGVMP